MHDQSAHVDPRPFKAPEQPTADPPLSLPMTAIGVTDDGLELATLRDRLGFYESFDAVIQANVRRAGDLLRDSAAARAGAVSDLVAAQRALADRQREDRSAYRRLFSDLLDEVSMLQGGLERLARRVADTLDDLETELHGQPPSLGGLVERSSGSAIPAEVFGRGGAASPPGMASLGDERPRLEPARTTGTTAAMSSQPEAVDNGLNGSNASPHPGVVDDNSESGDPIVQPQHVADAQWEGAPAVTIEDLDVVVHEPEVARSDDRAIEDEDRGDSTADPTSATSLDKAEADIDGGSRFDDVSDLEPFTLPTADDPPLDFDADETPTHEAAVPADESTEPTTTWQERAATEDPAEFMAAEPDDSSNSSNSSTAGGGVVFDGTDHADSGAMLESERQLRSPDAAAESEFDAFVAEASKAAGVAPGDSALVVGGEAGPTTDGGLNEGAISAVGDLPSDHEGSGASRDRAVFPENGEHFPRFDSSPAARPDGEPATPAHVEGDRIDSTADRSDGGELAEADRGDKVAAWPSELRAAASGEGVDVSAVVVAAGPTARSSSDADEMSNQAGVIDHGSHLHLARSSSAGYRAPDPDGLAASQATTTMLTHGVPRATTALSLKRYLEALVWVSAVEPREYAEGVLRLHVRGDRPLRMEDLAAWQDGAALETVNASDNLLEVRIPR